jgi:fatty acid desaturase
MLHPVRWMNNLVGHIVGTVLAIPLSVYRYAHAQHHAHLASENDPELWPFVKPGTPRWKRLLAAALAIAFGTIYSPFLFLRAVLVAPRLSKRLARKIAAEYAGSMLLWSVVLAVVCRWHWWELFAVGVAAPIMLAGTYQTLRLYTEHMGLMGDSPLSSTRTVAATRGPGRLLSLSMWHVDHHGAHHVDARIPNYHLPEATRILCDAGDPRGPIYESYLSAFVAMLPTLGDPKIGRQWIEADP